jgi:hypothetical protein
MTPRSLTTCAILFNDQNELSMTVFGAMCYPLCVCEAHVHGRGVSGSNNFFIPLY